MSWTRRVLYIFLILIWALSSYVSLESINDIETKNNRMNLSQEVENNIHKTQLKNPITSVLISFRAYDTLLELGVLIIVILGLFALKGGGVEFTTEPKMLYHPLVKDLSYIVVPCLILTGGYLLWAGTSYPGGAFQSGAILGVAGVLLAKIKIIKPMLWRPSLVIALSYFALIIFTLIGFINIAIGENFLEYPQEYSYFIIFFIESCIALSTAIILIMFYVFGQELIIPKEKVE